MCKAFEILKYRIKNGYILDGADFTKAIPRAVTSCFENNGQMCIAGSRLLVPVLSILTYRTEEEAIEIANDTEYGLGAYISSSNIEKANQIASQIVAGTVYINDVMLEMKAPFGGFKQSGIGRECGIYGLEEHLEPKTILISNENI